MINNHFHPPPIHNSPYTSMSHPALNGGFPRCPKSKLCEHNPSPPPQVPQQVQSIAASLNSLTYEKILHNITTTGIIGSEIVYISPIFSLIHPSYVKVKSFHYTLQELINIRFPSWSSKLSLFGKFHYANSVNSSQVWQTVKKNISLGFIKHYTKKGNVGVAPRINLDTRWKCVVNLTSRSIEHSTQRTGPQRRCGRNGEEKNLCPRRE